jgi:transcriptional regulator with XRE-family HTH domain
MSLAPGHSNTVVSEKPGEGHHQAGLTPEALSFRAGVSRPYISQLERNLKSPTVAMLFLICDALNVRAADIVRRVDAARRRQAGP